MPLRPLRPCKNVTCIQLTRDASGYCSDHALTAKEQHAEYKRSRSDKREQVFYNSSAWLKVRTMAMSRDHGLCQQCRLGGKVTLADVVHHRIEVKSDWSLRLVLDNCVCLCASCHNKVHRGRG